MKKLFVFALLITLAFCTESVFAQQDGGIDAPNVGDTTLGQNTGGTGGSVDTNVPGGSSSPDGSLDLTSRESNVEATFGQGNLLGTTAGSAGTGPTGPATGGGGRNANTGRNTQRNVQQLNNFQQNTQNQRIIRDPLRLGFIYVRQPVAQIAAQTNVRFTNLPRFKNSDVKVGFSDGVAILRGSVKNKNDKRMAELVAMFEPGVDKVKNELVVSIN